MMYNRIHLLARLRLSANGWRAFFLLLCLLPYSINYFVFKFEFEGLSLFYFSVKQLLQLWIKLVLFPLYSFLT